MGYSWTVTSVPSSWTVKIVGGANRVDKMFVVESRSIVDRSSVPHK